MIAPNPKSFPLGQVVATPGALALLEQHQEAASTFLGRHSNCDWGDVCDEDQEFNNVALSEGGRLLSSYHLGEGRIWIITEADRSSTCLLLPEEY